MTAELRNTQIKAVIFDYGGVLIDLPAKRWAAFEQQRGLVEGSLMKTWISPELFTEYKQTELGNMGLLEYEALFVKTYNRQYNRTDECLPIFTETMNKEKAPCVPQMVELIQKLRKSGYKTALLSNMMFKDATKTETMCFADHSWFDVAVESCLEGMRKPEPRIYDLVLDRLKCHPSEAVFLDDLSSNLKPAAEMGMQTILVKSVGQAIDDLEKLLNVPLASHSATDLEEEVVG